jgi:hypothetical protein
MIEPIKIRPLTNRDLKTVAKMAGKVAGKSRADITKAAKGKEGEFSIDIFQLFQAIATEVSDELMAWFADLIGKTAEEFDEMPPVTTVQIIEALKEQGDFKDFLSQVSLLLGGQQSKS